MLLLPAKPSVTMKRIKLHFSNCARRQGDECFPFERVESVCASLYVAQQSYHYKKTGFTDRSCFPFGILKMVTYDEKGEVLREEIYEKIVLQPGEIRKIGKFYSSRYAERYQYKFTYHPPEAGR